MKAKLITTIIVLNLISAGFLSADSHEDAGAEAVLEATRNWNRTNNRAEWEEHYSYYAPGCTEFWGWGMIRSRFNGENSWENKVKQSTEWTKKGGKRNISLKHPEVTMHGDIAIVTTYMAGSVKPPESERRNNLINVTIVWKKTEDGWKIVHAHYSSLQRDLE